MITKVFRVQHRKVHSDMRFKYIMLPYGYAYNAELLKAKRGDKLRFLDGDDAIIESVSLMPLEAKYCDGLCRAIYGISLLRALQIWQNNAQYLGYGKKAVSDDECLFVIYAEEKDGDEDCIANNFSY